MNKYELILHFPILKKLMPEDFNLIKELVERATPKKPVLINRQPYFKKYYKSGYTCPICHNKMYGATIYCHNCGQKLEWESYETKRN